MELVWDEESGEYILKPIANTEQMTIFDADFRCVNDPDEEPHDEQPVLEGRCVAALPGPSADDEEHTEPDPENKTGEAEDMSGEFNGEGPLPFEDDDEGYGYEPGDEY